MFANALALPPLVEPPPSLEGVVARPGLLQQLEGGAAARLLLIVASAGYGKTTLLTEWLEMGTALSSDAETVPLVVWYPLTDADNDSAHLLGGVQAAVRAALPEPAAFQTVDETQASLAYPLLLMFQRSAELSGRRWRLVLDDYHLLTNAAMHRAFDTLLNQPAWPVQLVLASRTLPPLDTIARLRVEGRLVELDEHDLRFSAAETAALFAAGGVALEGAELQAVTARTEGWAAALRLVCQAAQRETATELPRLLAQMGAEGHLFDYLAGQVLNRQPAEIQDFLRRTALLPYLEANLCNAYLGAGGAHGILDTLEREHQFVVRLPEGPPRRYRYHTLVAEFLGRCLEQVEGAPSVQAWHRRAAECFRARAGQANAPERIDQYLIAVHHWLAAQDGAAAAETLEEILKGWLLDQDQIVRRLNPWLDRLPAEVMAAHPRLLIVRSVMRRRQGRWSEALEALAQAEAALTQLEIGRGDAAVSERAQILLAQGWVHVRQGHYAKTKETCQHAMRLLSAQPSLLRELAAVYNLLCGVYSETGDIEAGYDYGCRALEIYETLGDRVGMSKGLHNIAMGVLYLQGRLAEAIEWEQRTVRIHDELGSYQVCPSLSGLAYAYQARGDYDLARPMAERLLQLADTQHDIYQRGYALTQLGHVHRAQGRAGAAQACYEEARTIGEELHEPNLLFEPRQGLALLALAHGDLSEALRQAQIALKHTRDTGYRHCEGLMLATLGLVLDRRGDTAQAEADFVEALAILQKLGANLDVATTRLYLAGLYWQEDRKADALDQLAQSLALSRQYGFDFLFTRTERVRALPLLLGACGQGVEAAEAARLLRLSGPEVAEPLLTLATELPADAPALPQVVKLLGEIGDERAMPVLNRLRRRRNCKAVAETALERLAALPAPELRVLTLGGFQVWRGGALIPAEAWQQRRKARLLFVYLLVQRRRLVPRDELLEALWPELAPESARRVLNTTFSELRKLLEPHLVQGQASRYLVREEDGYGLKTPDRIFYDVDAFEHKTDLERHALELYRGDFLQEEVYAEWVVRERERLRELYLNSLTRSLEQEMEQGAWRKAIDVARHILEREPWLEEVWRALMTSCMALGRRSEALQAYQACERSLRQELDVTPSAPTRALYDQLRGK